MSAYHDFGEALYAFVEALDISDVDPVGWAYTFNRLPKSDEMDAYPSFAVVPARDTQEILDSITDDVAITYSVYLFVRYWDANVPEADIRELADLVRTALAQERRKPEPLGGSYTLAYAGEWGYDPDQVQRYYRLDVTARFSEDIEP
jgi:hypothetical protein